MNKQVLFFEMYVYQSRNVKVFFMYFYYHNTGQCDFKVGPLNETAKTVPRFT